MELASILVMRSLNIRAETPSVMRSSTCPTALTDATLWSEKAMNQQAVVIAPNRPTGQTRRQWINDSVNSRRAINNRAIPIITV